MNIYEKLLAIQTELKAPKGQYNSFGKYNYRSCEDILEAVKPICAKYKTACIVPVITVQMGDRFYQRAAATLIDIEKPEDKIEVISDAREEETKKGMDGSQVTGTASSYARKYALNGLFCIDDTKDADTDEYKKQTDKPEPKIDKINIDKITGLINKYAEMKNGNAGELTKYYLTKYSVKEIKDLTFMQGIAINKELTILVSRRGA